MPPYDPPAPAPSATGLSPIATNIRRFRPLGTGLLFGGAILLGLASAEPEHPSTAYFFGDSLTDCCVHGRTANGPNWSDLLPGQIGRNYVANARINLAAGGAQSGQANVLSGTSWTGSGFLSQVRRFAASGTRIGPNDIAGIWIGANDIWPSTDETTLPPSGGPTSPRQPLGPQPDVPALTSYVVGNIRTGIHQLKGVGIRNFVLLSPYDLAQSALVSPKNKSLGTAYSDAIRVAESRLYTPGVDTYFVDVEGLLRQVQADPGAYGFLHTTAMDSCAAANCTSQPQSVQNTYIFNDSIHFTTAFHRLIAAHAAAVISAGHAVAAPAVAPRAEQPLSSPRWVRALRGQTESFGREVCSRKPPDRASDVSECERRTLETNGVIHRSGRARVQGSSAEDAIRAETRRRRSVAIPGAAFGCTRPRRRGA